MKIVWQYDDCVYNVVGENQDCWVVLINNREYYINKNQCAVYEETTKEEKKHSHYHKDVSNLETVDVYKVCELFDVQDASGAIHHAVKKLLCSGYRGVKDRRQDIQEAVDTLNRWLEMTEEK